ncbi:MAG: class I SAM-dependent methyltransferase [bacterium]|nr:class I SAM-dependent methyltransferase [bacterium]
MDTLDFIVKRYGLTLHKDQFLVRLRSSRWREMPLLFRDLGCTKGVEVGVYRGKFSAALCAPNPNLFLTGVDAWTVYEAYNEYTVDDLEREAFIEAKARTEKYNIKLIKAWSMDAVKTFEDESLDFVFIDANHDFAHVTEDIAAWSKKVKKGGLVCGHDYIKNSTYDFGVIDAVNSWCNAHDIKFLFVWKDQCPSWMYIKK